MPKTTLSKSIESFAITVGFILVSTALQNPLSLKSPFPWIWFAPVLISLQHGLWLSQGSMVLILSAYLFKNPDQINNIDFQLFVLGGFLLTTLCAMFHSHWSKKINASDNISTYLQKRIQSIANSYNLTALAYRGLEQNYIMKPITIRSSLQSLREMLAKNHQHSEALYRFLNLIAMHCSLETAAIFSVKNKRLASKPLAAIGKTTTPDQNNFLIQECLDTSAITYIKAKEILKGNFTDILIVAPFINQQDKIYAVLIVEAMPFLSLHDENIATLSVLFQYFLAGNTVENAELILKKYPDCPVMFANELQRLTYLQHSTKQDSAVVAFIVSPHPHQEDYLFRLKQERRGLDTSWEIDHGSKKILIVIMPLTYHVGVENYKIRINHILEHEFQTQLNQNIIQFKACQISAFTNPIDLIQDLLQKK